MDAGKKQQQMTAVKPGPEIEDFANALDACLAPGLSVSEKKARVLDLPRKYHENAIRRLAHKRPMPRRGCSEDMDLDVDERFGNGSKTETSEDVTQLEKEVQTWHLFRRLLPPRYSDSTDESTRLSPFPASKPAQRDSLGEYLATDGLALERRAVLQWLQTNSASEPDIDDVARKLQQDADRGDIIAHGWLHTRSKIKLRKSMTAWPHLLDRQSPNVTASHLNADGAPLVTHLDPDASTRQRRKLEPQDEFFERAIWLGCLKHLRRGSSLEDIREWCQERTELWRAVSMSAMPLSVDDNQGPASNIDPSALVLWRRMCLALARQGGSSDDERAVYGMLSGDILSVEKVAKTWDDYLFANYNALLRSQIDTYMLSQCPSDVASNLTQSFSTFDAVQFHGDQEGIEKRLINSIASRPNMAAQAMEPNKALQASFIAKELERHLFEQGLVLTKQANESKVSRLVRPGLDADYDVVETKYFDFSQHSGLRIVAHVFVLIALLKRFEGHRHSWMEPGFPPDKRFTQENILASYTDYLRRCKLQELIPLYCSVLDSPRSYEVLAWNVIEEADPNNRITQLKLIKRAGIDVLEFVERQATLLFDELDHDATSFGAEEWFKILDNGPATARHGRPIKPDFFGDEEDKVDIKDVHVIRALEWLLTVSETWPKVFSIGTRVYKFFLRNSRLNAARRLMQNVSFSEVMRGTMDHDDGYVMHEDADFWARQLQLSGIEGARPEQVMTDARNYRELEALVKALDNLETMASLAVISRDADTSNREFWKGVGATIDATKDNMQPLLQNWLLSGIEAGDEELKKLRQAYLPETILAYVSALHFAGTGLTRDHLLDCMELSSVIAERNSDLADVFVSTGRVRELVEAFTWCSKALAIATGDSKRSVGSASKKLRYMGWSRDLWSIRN
ncbi:nuclear pore complex protein Nup107 [Metarhizium album ARSEF 1941]|uniref:Nuclear pore complex protein n=1 Tax=Metarhizium album (strain ARSEF 1941) TaxID=1081103 RepID=A0A0B2WWW3_METAS|nr:nuclear pore complex protein Nup107 [Metarhizium album ARSEF 1941]KHN98548.1 nuclear pore complex protein Nup107 [Metarhizium album ARSEF 1941]